MKCRIFKKIKKALDKNLFIFWVNIGWKARSRIDILHKKLNSPFKERISWNCDHQGPKNILQINAHLMWRDKHLVRSLWIDENLEWIERADDYEYVAKLYKIAQMGALPFSYFHIYLLMDIF